MKVKDAPSHVFIVVDNKLGYLVNQSLTDKPNNPILFKQFGQLVNGQWVSSQWHPIPIDDMEQECSLLNHNEPVIVNQTNNISF